MTQREVTPEAVAEVGRRLHDLYRSSQEAEYTDTDAIWAVVADVCTLLGLPLPEDEDESLESLLDRGASFRVTATGFEGV